MAWNKPKALMSEEELAEVHIVVFMESRIGGSAIPHLEICDRFGFYRVPGSVLPNCVATPENYKLETPIKTSRRVLKFLHHFPLRL